MRNIFINYYRKYKNVVEFEYNEVTEKNEPVEESDFTGEELIRLLANIKDEFRCVIILFHINEYSLKEIAAELNWPLGTVKSRLYRARKKFREVLENSMQARTA
jgi:RNA polymerase sigma-70 factor (ECF subfamily)